jgi:hypothetical protein
MGTFNADSIYQHMATAHGGYHREAENNIAGEGDFYEQEQIMLHGQLLRAAQEVRRREVEGWQWRVAEQRRAEEERWEVERRVEDERRVAEQRREEEQRGLERRWVAWQEEARRRLAEQRRLEEVRRQTEAAEQHRRQQNKGFGCIIM